jgi:hypothetical protein
MAEALSLCKGQPVDHATVMLHRTAVMLEIAAERKGWPDRITGLSDRRAIPPRRLFHDRPSAARSRPCYIFLPSRPA